MESLIQILPHVNASLNALATLLLVAGYWLIKQSYRTTDAALRQRREVAHKWAMLSCFGVSVVFLACYLTYHYARHEVLGDVGKQFKYSIDAVRYVYYGILISHVVLAAVVPFAAVATIYYALRDRRSTHLRLAKWTFPIWLYVSVTGVVVYGMLYWLSEAA